MSWLDVIQISTTITFLVAVGVIGIVFLMLWAMEKKKGIEMFVGLVIVTVWITLTFLLHKGG